MLYCGDLDKHGIYDLRTAAIYVVEKAKLIYAERKRRRLVVVQPSETS